MVYNETGSSSFSLSGFHLREVRLKSIPCLAARKALVGGSPRTRSRSGGFGFKESSSLFSPSRNRFIIWYEAKPDNSCAEH